MGPTAYGFGLITDRMTCEDSSKMPHLDETRIDQEHLRRSAGLREAGS
jgi:hypothetical protein